jgi:hypothetical protein
MADFDAGFRVEPNTRLGLQQELDKVAADRARATRRPVVVAGFTGAEKLHVLETAVNEDERLVVVRRRVIANPRDAIAAKMRRVSRRVLLLARRATG